MKNLVIVESPAKAKTIEKYLGKDFKVLSSIGHIRNIIKKTKDGQPPIDTNNGFETIYEIDGEKKKIISELRKAVKTADIVWLATDEDREGEAIAWHLAEVLKLNPKTTKRIAFHEITKNAIEEAVKNPRTIDMNLVQAQQARQILDRLVGFELSPVVWRKVPGGKSAGRVQSPAVRLLVEREREVDAFNSSFTFKIIAEFNHESEVIKAELPSRFNTEVEAKKFLEGLMVSTFTVSDITTSPSTRSPSAPFTTSTLQQDANNQLGFSIKATMSSAQKLYQDGKITYMRTDSVNLSGQAIAMATAYIKSGFGEKYSQVRKFKTKSVNAQEAHEAIRPTDIHLEKASSNEYDQKLYDLIRRRTLASQMCPAKMEKTTITINITSSSSSATILNNNAALQSKSDQTLGPLSDLKRNNATKDDERKDVPNKVVFEAKGEVIIFDGFLKVYGERKKESAILPIVELNDILTLKTAAARQVFGRPPSRYSEGSLVKKLEDLGIGRPSTYATIINTVQLRGYAEKGESEGEPRNVINLKLDGNTIKRATVTERTGSNKGKLVPTPTGEVVSDFLSSHFDQIVDYGFTAKVETSFDKIATGSLARNTMLDNFYVPFHKLIEGSSDIDRSTVAKSRTIGKDPKTGKIIIARFGRYGPMLQLGNSDKKEDQPRFASIPAGHKIDTVTLDKALHAFKLPRIIGKTDDGSIIKANIGRFGPYIQINKLFVGIKPQDPHTITLDQALELYDKKLKVEAEKNITDFGDNIKILKGRFGPYITDGKKNVKVPKETDPISVTLDEAKKLLKASNTKKHRLTNKKTVYKNKA
jgi:DNA topoisomerase-1